MADADWANLARLARERRNRLLLSQEDVASRGGPSTATQRLIEHGHADSYKPRTFAELEKALQLHPGSIRSALDGGPFFPAEAPAPASPDPPRYADPLLQRVYDAAEGLSEQDRHTLAALAERLRGGSNGRDERRA